MINLQCLSSKHTNMVISINVDYFASRPVSYAEWSARPLRERVGERLASLFGSQL